MYAAQSVSPTANRGFRTAFAEGRLTLGLMLPIESFVGDAPTMANQVELVRRAEHAGFASIGFRDVPLRDPSFGDVGQAYDPWVYLGYLAAQTERIALLTTSIVLPLRHPIHTAKAAASLDRLTHGRLLLGVASGDRPVEFPAFGVEREARGERFREQLRLLTTYWSEDFPRVTSSYGDLDGVDVIPKPIASHVPLLVTGRSQNSLAWIAENADGWITYPRGLPEQAYQVEQWRTAVRETAPGCFKPFAQSYYIDLAADRLQPPRPIHLGHRIGRRQLVVQLEHLRDIGVNHVVLNLKYGTRPAREVLDELAEFVLPHFPCNA